MAAGEQAPVRRLFGTAAKRVRSLQTCPTTTPSPRFVATLKTKCFGDAAECMAFDYIETFHNRKRRHSTLGYQSPQTLAKLAKQIAAPPASTFSEEDHVNTSAEFRRRLMMSTGVRDSGQTQCVSD